LFQGFIFKGFPGLGFQFLIDRVSVNLTVPVSTVEMWKWISHSFKSAVKKALGSPVIVADRFHFVRYVHWALERVRIRVQKGFSDYDRKKCKKKRRVFHKDSSKLTKEDQWYLDRYLSMHPDLQKAYELKESFKKWFKEAKAEGLNLEEVVMIKS